MTPEKHGDNGGEDKSGKVHITVIHTAYAVELIIIIIMNVISSTIWNVEKRAGSIPASALNVSRETLIK